MLTLRHFARQVQTIGGRQKIFGSAATAFGKLAAKDGFTSLYIGVEVLALKTIAYSALSFAAYEVAKAALIPILEPKTKEMETCAICSDENMT